MNPVNVGDLLDHMQALSFPKIRLDIARPDEELWVLGDAAQLQQVLTNLALNARDAMPDGGVLHVSVETTEELDDKPTVSIIVGDTGMGIAPDVLEHIFEPLFTTKRGTGTGLGLAITYQIVIAHAGRISVSSNVGEGSTFRVSLRQTTAPAAQIAPQETTPIAGLRRVVLIEDEEAVSSGIAATLESQGIEVMIYERGDGAVEFIEAQKPDAVILDIGLPDISGWNVLSKLRKKMHAIPVVISSGHAVESDSIGMIEYAVIIRKPYETAELLNALESLLRKS
jgi:CheY-like chemotaxis protein